MSPEPHRCRICGVAETETPSGRLVITHDPMKHGVAEKIEEDLPVRRRRAQPVRLAPFTPHLER